MRVFVTGAAGYLGLSVVRACARRGHTVLGLARNGAQAERIRREGGAPVLGDVLTASSYRDVAVTADAVVHLAQPSEGDLSLMRSVRVEGGRTLAETVRDRPRVRFVVGSGYWVYASHPGIVDEESPLEPRSISQINFDTERAVAETLQSAGAAPIVVRPGMVYGRGSWFQSMVTELQKGEYRYVGDGSNYLSPVHLDDAGEAFADICERAPVGTTYLVVDDLPARTSEFAAFVADRLATEPPRSISFDAAAEAWGKDLALLNVASRRATNARLRRLGWVARWKSYRDGVPAVLRGFAGDSTG